MPKVAPRRSKVWGWFRSGWCQRLEWLWYGQFPTSGCPDRPLGHQNELHQCLWDPKTKCNTAFGTPDRTATLSLGPQMGPRTTWNLIVAVVVTMVRRRVHQPKKEPTVLLLMQVATTSTTASITTALLLLLLLLVLILHCCYYCC